MKSSTPILRWSALMAAMSAEQRTDIKKLAARTVELIHPWSKRHSIIPQNRVNTTVFTLAVAVPEFSPDDLAIAAQLCLWIFAVDDLYDEKLLGDIAPEQHLLPIAGLLDGETLSDAHRDDPYHQVFREICLLLSQHPLYIPFRAHLKESLLLLFRSMAKENEWRDEYQLSNQKRLPAFGEYVENGASSIGMRSLYRTLMILLGDAMTPLHWPLLMQIEQEAATSVRLSNDLATYERELSEKNINALVILTSPRPDGGPPLCATLDQARDEVKAQIEQALAKCVDLCQASDPAESASVKQAFLNHAWFACSFYHERDFRDPFTLA